MSITTIAFPIPRGWAPSVLERQLLGGPDGAHARFTAVGAADAYYELALARSEPSADEDDPAAARIGIATDGVLELGWSDAAGTCSMLVAYGIHLVLVRAQATGQLDDVRGVLASGRFAETRGRLAQRAKNGLRLQEIRATDAHLVPLESATLEERALHERLASSCACPACTSRMWTEHEADALAEAIEADADAALPELARCMMRTPRLLRAAMRAGVHARAGRTRRLSLWTASVPPRPGRAPESVVPTLAMAASIAPELLDDRSVEVRAAAHEALVAYAAYDETRAPLALARALADKPKIAELALVRARAFSTPLASRVATLVLDAIEFTNSADVAGAAMDWCTVHLEALDETARARARTVIARWTGTKKLVHSLDAAKRAGLVP